uniref:Tetratricopeptide repeat protein n=1 Tax=Streptomyces sp. NBC_00049 TaxID=2903617 RepID=A0AAU2JZY4_9ACTN
MTIALDDVRRLVKAGDLPGAVRSLRPRAETLPVAELAKATRLLADAAGFKDLAAAAKAAAKRPENPQALYDLGYGCVERGVAFLGVAPLREALRLLPDSRPLLAELVSALEDEHRHTDAAALLAARGDRLPAWPETYLLVHHTLLAGDLDTAEGLFVSLPAPEDPQWSGAHGLQTRRVLRSLQSRRAQREAGHADPLGPDDLRGWHYGLTGGLLGTLSPYGWDAGMTGRYAYLGDGPELCRRGLARLSLALEAADRRPGTVSLLPGRSDRILGLAAARVFGLPAVPYEPTRTDTLVVAYDLGAVDHDLVRTLHARTDGQVLHEHATCWTDPPAVSADFSTLLCQYAVPRWKDDDRPEEEIAHEIATADPAADEGDGETPADPDEAYLAFVTKVRTGWLSAPRDRMASPGPVPSSRFA